MFNSREKADAAQLSSSLFSRYVGSLELSLACFAHRRVQFLESLVFHPASASLLLWHS